ncbi:MAG TPA: hypothetical protein VFW38_00895 [Solirubrobacteraceae bacterium]|nr:hypothetical protein [Solirubrobacteraceae bacterium]
MSNRKACQRFVAGLASLLCATAGWLAAVAPASATQYSATCATLQSDLNAASADPLGGMGDTVTLTEMCGAAGENAGSYVLPTGSAFTLEGIGADAGFDATGLGGAQLQSPLGEGVAGLTISHLSFEGSSDASQGALVLYHDGGTLSVREDRFLKDAALSPSPVELTDNQLGCPGGAGNSGITVERSVFREDTGAATSAGLGAGGGMLLSIECGLDAFTIAGNEFLGDRLTPASGQPGSGAGLAIANSDAKNLAHVTQLDNVFDSNSVIADGSSRYVGGGEDAAGVDLTSTDDRFSRNSLPGTSGSGNFSWGAGLSVENSGCQTISPASTLIQAIVAANTISDSGTEDPGLAQGAGVYVGCAPPVGYSNSLTLLDSTVTNNVVTPAAATAVAGIAGHPSDRLSLENTILWGDAGGAELGGFTGVGGSLAAAFSDVCVGSGPFPGVGNICADPLLVSDKVAGSFDVHETADSPTIDTGANTLVPNNLSADAFGVQRALPGHVACHVHYPFVVDIGAAEFQAVQNFACALLVPVVSFSFPSVKQLAGGVLRLTFRSPAHGRLAVKGQLRLTETVRKRHKRIKHTRTLAYGKVSVSTPNDGSVSFDLRPTKAALALLERHKRLHVKLMAAYTPSFGSGGSKSRKVLVKYKAPPRKRRRRA